MEAHKIGGSNFGFSAKRIADLGASEYTLVVIAVDATGSVYSFKQEIEQTIKSVVKSCRRSPRADNLMLRVITFNTSVGVNEVHGFKPLMDCNEANYTNSVDPKGSTNLFDAAYSAAGSLVQYGKDLTDQDYNVNGIFVVITDGEDNASLMTPSMVKDQISKCVQEEALESMTSILVGVGTDQNALQRFQVEAGMAQFVNIADATERNLAKLAAFVSKSISATSQALGTGGPSQALVF
jgi:uncharacterized protein YegL